MYRECCMHLLQRHYAKITTWEKDGPSISERWTISECGMWYDSESAMPDLIQTTSPLAAPQPLSVVTLYLIIYIRAIRTPKVSVFSLYKLI